MLLFIDTAGKEGRLQLADQEHTLAQYSWQNGRETGSRLLQALDDGLKTTASSLTAIARVVVVAGPGHYSSLRTGIVAATLLAKAARADLCAVNAGEPVSVKHFWQIPPRDTVKPVYTNE